MITRVTVTCTRACGQLVALYGIRPYLTYVPDRWPTRQRTACRECPFAWPRQALPWAIIGHIPQCGQEIANQEPGPPSSLQAACCRLHWPWYSSGGTTAPDSSHSSHSLIIRVRPPGQKTDRQLTGRKKSIKEASSSGHSGLLFLFSP